MDICNYLRIFGKHGDKTKRYKIVNIKYLNKDYMKSRMWENCTYGSVRGQLD